MSKKLQRMLSRKKSIAQKTAEATVYLVSALGCRSVEELQAALVLAGYDVNPQRFSKLPPLSELRKRVHQPILNGKQR